MMKLVQRGYILWLVPLTLWGLTWYSNPFSHQIVVKRFSLVGLSPQQIVNLTIAAKELDGLVIHPSETFSFNREVGPRTRRRGYLEAYSYLGQENLATLGGGICLLSSALYQVALASGLTIEERVPHLRTIRTVPPGLDATVWYGQADLRFKNTLKVPLQLETRMVGRDLIVAVKGSDTLPQAPVWRRVTRQVPGYVQVEVFRRQGVTETLVSRDLYSLAP